MKRYRIHVIVAAAFLCAGGVIGFVDFTGGVRVTIRNTGQDMMRDVMVQVTGRNYPIGELTPGSSWTRRVSPTGESSVQVEFTDEMRRRVRLAAGCYFEPGYRGQIEVEIRDGKVIAVKDEIRIGIY